MKVVNKEGAYVRFGVKHDSKELLRIERASFADPWTNKDFIQTLAVPNVVCRVAEREDQIVGYIIWECHKQYMHILNMAVMPECRGHGIGSHLLKDLEYHLGERWKRVSAEVREENVVAQKFLKANGFRCTHIAKNFFEGDIDALCFEYRDDWTPDGYDVLRSIMEGKSKVLA